MNSWQLVRSANRPSCCSLIRFFISLRGVYDPSWMVCDSSLRLVTTNRVLGPFLRDQGNMLLELGVFCLEPPPGRLGCSRPSRGCRPGRIGSRSAREAGPVLHGWGQPCGRVILGKFLCLAMAPPGSAEGDHNSFSGKALRVVKCTAKSLDQHTHRGVQKGSCKPSAAQLSRYARSVSVRAIQKATPREQRPTEAGGGTLPPAPGTPTIRKATRVPEAPAGSVCWLHRISASARAPLRAARPRLLRNARAGQGIGRGLPWPERHYECSSE